jgi:hypothetical protein
VLPNLSRETENELDTRLAPSVINRLRLNTLHDCKIRCTLQESLPLAPTTERLRKAADLQENQPWIEPGDFSSLCTHELIRGIPRKPAAPLPG